MYLLPATALLGCKYHTTDYISFKVRCSSLRYHVSENSVDAREVAYVLAGAGTSFGIIQIAIEDEDCRKIWLPKISLCCSVNMDVTDIGCIISATDAAVWKPSGLS